MAKETTFEKKIDALTSVVERGFAAIAGDIADIRKEMATKEQALALQSQINSIEGDIRSMKHSRLDFRVADLEEKAFGKIRS